MQLIMLYCKNMHYKSLTVLCCNGDRPRMFHLYNTQSDVVLHFLCVKYFIISMINNHFDWNFEKKIPYNNYSVQNKFILKSQFLHLLSQQICIKFPIIIIIIRCYYIDIIILNQCVCTNHCAYIISFMAFW